MADAGGSRLEDFPRLVSPDHEDGLVWFRRSLLEGGERVNPNTKHLMSLNQRYREERRK